jgi:membrane protease YdiL (CAAX protease family)
MDAVDNRRGRRSLPVYFFVAYAFTWLLWVPPLLDALPRGWAMPSPDNYAHLAADGFANNRHLLLALTFSVAVYGPLLGALIATGYERGSHGVRDLLARTFNPRVALRWYLVALIIAAALSYLPTLLAWITGSLEPPLLDTSARLALFVPILLLQLLTSGLGEEPGWRGYLLPSLQERFSPVRSVWLLGLAWAVWHYPLTATYALSGVPANAPAPAGVITVVIALLSQTLGSIGLTYLYVWLFNRTRSIFLMIVFHALTNALPFLVPPARGPWALIVGVFPWIIVLVLWLITRHDFLRSDVGRTRTRVQG